VGHLDLAVDVAAYRIVQESLNNARRHAPGKPVLVRIDRGPELQLEVRNEAVPTAPGRGAPQYGLVGMRERALLLGGELVARREGPEFVVRARLPAVVTA
jgi:signal transduction histidine kinase